MIYVVGGGSIASGKVSPRIKSTNAASDSSVVYYALTMRSIMALGKSAGSSSFRMSTDDQVVGCNASRRVGSMGGIPL